VATSDAAFRGGACPTPEYTIAYTGNYTTSADASSLGRTATEVVWSGCRESHLLASPRTDIADP
jgi:hypothetical protein